MVTSSNRPRLAVATLAIPNPPLHSLYLGVCPKKWVNVPQKSTVLAGLAQGDEFDEHYGYGPPQAAGLSWRSGSTQRYTQCGKTDVHPNQTQYQISGPWAFRGKLTMAMAPSTAPRAAMATKATRTMVAMEHTWLSGNS